MEKTIREVMIDTKKETLFFTSLVLLAIASCLTVEAVSARVIDLYWEKRVHNNKIEMRLEDWYKSAQLHTHSMNISDHPKIAQWREQLVELDLMSDEISGLKALNTIINGDVTYIDDYHHFHKEDFWADPETTIVEGGDCEDIALVKAATLQRFNWPEDRMHLLVGYLTERGRKESHAVLLVETSEGDQFILRSINNQIVRPSEYAFIPIYAVDHAGTMVVKAHHLVM